MATTDDTSDLSRAIIAATDRKRAPFVYRPASPLTPTEQWERRVRETLELALSQARVKTVVRR